MENRELQEIKSVVQASTSYWVAVDADKHGLVLSNENLLRIISTIEGLQNETEQLGKERDGAIERSMKRKYEVEELRTQKRMLQELYDSQYARSCEYAGEIEGLKGEVRRLKEELEKHEKSL